MADISTPTNLAALLRQISSTDKTSNPVKKTEPRPTIFDLRKEDRYRILKLIEELLDAQEEVDKLKSKLEEQRMDFSEKRNTLLKKLDRLNDKHEKTLCDMEMQKEGYSGNLKHLQDKITTVSDKFEASAAEIKELRKTNAALSEENAALKKLNSQIVAVTSSYHIDKLGNSFDVRKYKEKGHRRHLKKTMSEARANFDDKNMASLEAPSNQEITVVRPSPPENKTRGYPGAGDFTTDNISTSGIETIKAPTIVILDQSNPSALATHARNNTHTQVVAPAFEANKYQYPPLNFNSDDSAILENLFFRF